MFTRRTFLIGLPTTALAFPNKILTMVVPFTAGGSADILARLLMQELSVLLMQPSMIENKAGAGGSLAAAQVARANPDGHTLFMGHLGTLAVNPHIYPKLDYDPLTSFTHLSTIATVHNILTVHPKHGFKTLADLVNFAKANPNKLSYGTGGIGSAAHLATLAFMQEVGIEMLHVPYRGTTPAMNDLLGGQIDLIFSGAPVLLPHVKAGSLTALACSGLKRLEAAQNIPTLAESINKPDFEVSQWYGVVAPAQLPVDVTQLLTNSIHQAMQNETVKAKLQEEGADILLKSPQEFQNFIETENKRWKVVIDKAGVKQQ